MAAAIAGADVEARQRLSGGSSIRPILEDIGDIRGVLEAGAEGGTARPAAVTAAATVIVGDAGVTRLEGMWVQVC
jgi:hypothetical protein